MPALWLATIWSKRSLSWGDGRHWAKTARIKVSATGPKASRSIQPPLGGRLCGGPAASWSYYNQAKVEEAAAFRAQFWRERVTLGARAPTMTSDWWQSTYVTAAHSGWWAGSRAIALSALFRPSIGTDWCWCGAVTTY